MMDYGSWGTSPRRPQRRGGRGRSGLVVLVLLVALGAGYVFVRHHAGAGRASAATVHGGAAQVTTPAEQLTLGACIDPTTSEVASFPQQVRSDLAAAVAGLAQTGQLPTSGPGNGPVTSSQPSVSLVVRQVDTTSFSTVSTPFSANVTIPGVPGLAESRPSPGGANYDTLLRAWSAGYQEVAAARASATAAAQQAQQTVSAMPLDQSPSSWSAISACVSALLLTTPGAGQHSYLLASDLEENVAPQLAGSFDGAPLVIVQACDSGNAASCQGLLASFEAEMRRLDVGPITVVRPEDAAAAIASWIRTGRSTP
jgi:hypothetical protein